jgi:hypothetical protein
MYYNRHIPFINQEGLDPDATAYLNFINMQDATYRNETQKLVKGLKIDGNWNDMEVLLPLQTDQHNQLSYTEDITNAVWTKVATTVTNISQTTPAGATVCSKLVPTTGNTFHYVYQTIGTTIFYDETVTIFCQAKADGYDWIRLVFDGGNGTFGRAWFNVNTGAVGTSSAVGMTIVSTTITPSTNGFFQIALTLTGAERSGVVWFSPSSADNQSGTWAGDGTSGVLVTETQFEFGLLSDYEPVIGASFSGFQMSINLKNPQSTNAAHRVVWNNATGFSSKGYNGSVPSSNWGNMHLDPLTYLEKDNTHLSIFSLKEYGLRALWLDMGCFDSTANTGSLHVTPDFDAQGMRCRVNSSTPTSAHVNNVTTGMFMANRVNSTHIETYVDGILKTTEPAVSSTNLSPLNMYLGAINENGVATGKVGRRLGFATVGKGLTPTKALKLYNRILTFNNGIRM